jgi:hypothetical protein
VKFRECLDKSQKMTDGISRMPDEITKIAEYCNKMTYTAAKND